MTSRATHFRKAVVTALIEGMALDAGLGFRRKRRDCGKCPGTIGVIFIEQLDGLDDHVAGEPVAPFRAGRTFHGVFGAFDPLVKGEMAQDRFRHRGRHFAGILVVFGDINRQRRLLMPDVDIPDHGELVGTIRHKNGNCGGTTIDGTAQRSVKRKPRLAVNHHVKGKRQIDFCQQCVIFISCGKEGIGDIRDNRSKRRIMTRSLGKQGVGIVGGFSGVNGMVLPTASRFRNLFRRTGKVGQWIRIIGTNLCAQSECGKRQAGGR